MTELATPSRERILSCNNHVLNHYYYNAEVSADRFAVSLILEP